MGVWYGIVKTVAFTLNELASQFDGFGGRSRWSKAKVVCLGCHVEPDPNIIFKSILYDRANCKFST